MEIRILDRAEQTKIYPEVLEMLLAADRDFVPPLSSRSSSTQKDLAETVTQETGVQEYYAQLKTQRFAAVFEGQRLIAFVSYKEDYTCEQIPATAMPNIYLSTLIVRPEARGKGVTTALYQMLFTHYAHVHIFTRTWSTNFAHIRILEKYGFRALAVLPNHRGNGIDTVYFHRAALGKA